MDYLKRLMKTQIKYIVFPLLLFVVIVNSSIFFGVCGSFEIVRYTGGSAREHQGFTYVHIDDDYDRISIDRFLEVKRALDGQYVHVDRLNSKTSVELTSAPWAVNPSETIWMNHMSGKNTSNGCTNNS